MQKRLGRGTAPKVDPQSDPNVRPRVDKWDGPFYRLFMCGEVSGNMTEPQRYDLFMDVIDQQGAWLFTLGGYAYYSVGERRILLEPGTVLALRRPAPGAIVTVPEGMPWRKIWVHVAGDNAIGLFDYIKSRFGIIHRLPLRNAAVTKARRLIRLARSSRNYSAHEWSLWTFDFLNTWWACAEKSAVPGDTILRSNAFDASLLSFHPGSIQELADKMGYSQTYLSRKLKAQWKESPGKVLHRARLHEAAKLLRTTKRQVMHISQQVGYQSTTAFIRAFKKAYGVSPLQYRHREN